MLLTPKKVSEAQPHMSYAAGYPFPLRRARSKRAQQHISYAAEAAVAHLKPKQR